MKKLFILSIVTFIACSQNTSNPNVKDVVYDEEVSTEEVTEDVEEVELDTRTDEIEDIVQEDETQPSCKDQLTDYQCLTDQDCHEGTMCSGVMSCGGQNCFGYCDVYPGTCVPKIKEKFCTATSQCPQDYVCVGLRICKGKSCLKETIPGICMWAGPGGCYMDENCPKGKYCAGAVACTSWPCYTKPLPGRCVSKPSTGCFDDRDCGKDEYCTGMTLCKPFDKECKDIPGTCKKRESCIVDQDCANPLRNFCEEGFKCKFENCAWKEKAGYCIKAPGPTACWESKECGDGYICKGSRPCESGSYCEASNAEEIGYCIQSPKPRTLLKQGIEILVPDTVKTNQPFNVAIINHTGITIAVPMTYTFVVQRKEGSKFTDFYADPKDPMCCLAPQGPFVGIPDGWVFTRLNKIRLVGKVKDTYRLSLDVYPESLQGFIASMQAEPPPIFPIFRVYSKPFTVIP